MPADRGCPLAAQRLYWEQGEWHGEETRTLTGGPAESVMGCAEATAMTGACHVEGAARFVEEPATDSGQVRALSQWRAS